MNCQIDVLFARLEAAQTRNDNAEISNLDAEFVSTVLYHDEICGCPRDRQKE